MQETARIVGLLSGTTGDVPLYSSITLSDGVSIPQTNNHFTINGAEGYIYASEGGEVNVHFTVGPTRVGDIFFVLKLNRAGTTVQVYDNFAVFADAIPKKGR